MFFRELLGVHRVCPVGWGAIFTPPFLFIVNEVQQSEKSEIALFLSMTGEIASYLAVTVLFVKLKITKY